MARSVNSWDHQACRCGSCTLCPAAGTPFSRLKRRVKGGKNHSAGVTKYARTWAQTCRNFPFGNLQKWDNLMRQRQLTQNSQTESFPFFLRHAGARGKKGQRGSCLINTGEGKDVFQPLRPYDETV